MLCTTYCIAWPGDLLLCRCYVLMRYNTTIMRCYIICTTSILDYTIIQYDILYYIILYYTILYYTILYYTILYYTILYYTILYYTILYYTILYDTILYYTIPYHTIPYHTILYYTISREPLNHRTPWVRQLRRSDSSPVRGDLGWHHTAFESPKGSGPASLVEFIIS